MQFLRRKKKYGILLGILGVAALVAISITGTVAYLTDRDDAQNIFKIGQIEIKLNSGAPDETLALGGGAMAMSPAPTVTNLSTITTDTSTSPGNPCYLKAEISVDVGDAPILDSGTLGTLLSIQLASNADSAYYWAPESGTATPDSDGWITLPGGKVTLYYQGRDSGVLGVLDCDDVPSEPIFTAVKLAASAYLEGQAADFELDIVITAIQSDYLDSSQSVENAFAQYSTAHPPAP